jgi:hypothetical protein
MAIPALISPAVKWVMGYGGHFCQQTEREVHGFFEEVSNEVPTDIRLTRW